MEIKKPPVPPQMNMIEMKKAKQKPKRMHKHWTPYHPNNEILTDVHEQTLNI